MRPGFPQQQILSPPISARGLPLPSCLLQIRKWSDPVDNGANMLIAVPGGGDGPGGVLVCSDNFIIYKNQVRGLPPSSRQCAAAAAASTTSLQNHAPEACFSSIGF